MQTAPWLLYGATGYTGRLIMEEAVRLGHRPTLAGRSLPKLEALGQEHELSVRAVGLSDPAALRSALEGQALVLHAAGPFVETSQPMQEACLAVGAHYLDITGELPVFAHTFRQDARALARKVALISGVGFDVVPSDCLGRYVAERCAGARTLELALWGTGGVSSGTAKSVLGLLPEGGKVRRGGELRSWALGRGITRIRFSDRQRWGLPAPLGDLETAYRTTRIPDITTYLGISGTTARALRLAWPLGVALAPLAGRALHSANLRQALHELVEQRVHGPDLEARGAGRAVLWARATAGPGEQAEAWLETPEAYAFTAAAAVRAVERVLAEKPAGALSPAVALGTDFVLQVPGTRRLDRLDG